MRIALVAPDTHSPVNFRGSLLRTLVEAGHQVFVFAPSGPRSEIDALLALGVDYVEVPLLRNNMNPLQDLRTLAFLRLHLRELRPAKVFSYTIKPAIYGSLAARGCKGSSYSLIAGLGYVFSSGSLKQWFARTFVSMLYRRALRANHKVFFQNPDDIKLFIRAQLIEADKAVLINGSGVDLDHFQVAPLPGAPITFLVIARLLRDKGLYEFVEAARRIRSLHPDVRFKILGPIDTNPTAISSEVVKSWDREGNVQYLGEAKDVRPYIMDASVLVLPSYREGTPRSVLEAMSMGRPVITTDAPGCRETVIDGHNGFLVPVRDAESLSQAMLRFIETPELMEIMGRASRSLAEEKYDVHKVNATILRTMELL